MDDWTHGCLREGPTGQMEAQEDAQENGLGENIHVTCSSAGTRLGNEPDFRLNFNINRNTSLFTSRSDRIISTVKLSSLLIKA